MGPSGIWHRVSGIRFTSPHLPPSSPKATHRYERVCATWPRAFCVRAAKQDTTQPFASRLPSSPNAPYLPELLKSEQPSTLVTVSITSVDRCSVPQSIGAYPRTAPGPVSARGRACTLTPVMVELIGIEPTTPCLQSRCSPKLSYSPFSGIRGQGSGISALHCASRRGRL